MLPDLDSLGNELWLVVVALVYGALNQSTLLQTPNQDARRQNYLRNRLFVYRKKYRDIIRSEAGSNIVEALTFSILIYESFNRPPLYQWLEAWVLARFRQSTTLGPMQVKSPNRIDADQSVRLGTRIVRASVIRAVLQSQTWERAPNQDVDESEFDIDAEFRRQRSTREWESALDSASREYNSRDDYAEEIMSVYRVVRSAYPWIRRGPEKTAATASDAIASRRDDDSGIEPAP